MKTPAEGRQIPIDSATKPQLRAFANHLGCTTSNFDTEEKLRAKIASTGYEEAHIIAFDGVQAKAVSAKAIAAGDEVPEPTVELTIHTQAGAGGKRHVFVGVNGKALLIPRNVKCEVKHRYLVALENALETQYEFDEDAKANVPREMPSYPHQVHRPVDLAALERYHVWYAAEEARLATKAA